jgi:hypothetical protein
MTFQGRIRASVRLVLVTGLAAAVAAPVAGAANPDRYAQIGGELVVPAQLSSWQAHAGQTSTGHLVQIGGALVAPERVSSYQAHASQANSSVTASSSGFGFDGSDAGIGIAVGLGAALFVAGSAYVRRMRLSQA